LLGVDIVASAILLKDAKVFKTPELTFLVAAVVKSGLAPTLSDPNANFTIYAPTDAAFKALGFKTVADVTALNKYFKNYFIESCYWGGKFTSEQTSTTAATAGGGTLTYSPFKRSFTIKVVELQHLQIWLFQIFNVVME
jgi:uncharacterized surface protein with fasciclin (FAS1) repeats